MNIPKSLKVGGHTFKVELVSGDKLNGVADMSLETGKIRISNFLTQTQQECALFHEILHAINLEFDEVIVEFLAQNIYQVLADNKLLK